ncbi:MAG: SDR family oxidoreductase [Actinobacteria bacterium]|nr:SDR family oxidoreductase [Actinomycetota bacterium]
MSGRQLAGQRAFITGGASGIGAEMARRFTREGATVVVADVNDTLGKQIIMSINVDGVVYGARAVIPGMVARKTGHILVTASLAGIIAIAPDPIYGLTKHAMVGLVKSLGPALEPHGVCISALCPGFLDTPLVSELAREYAKSFSMGVMDVSVAGDLAMRALTERIAGSQWTVMAGQPITQYIPAPPFS